MNVHDNVIVVCANGCVRCVYCRLGIIVLPLYCDKPKKISTKPLNQ